MVFTIFRTITESVEMWSPVFSSFNWKWIIVCEHSKVKTQDTNPLKLTNIQNNKLVSRQFAANGIQFSDFPWFERERVREKEKEKCAHSRTKTVISLFKQNNSIIQCVPILLLLCMCICLFGLISVSVIYKKSFDLYFERMPTLLNAQHFKSIERKVKVENGRTNDINWITADKLSGYFGGKKCVLKIVQ